MNSLFRNVGRQSNNFFVKRTFTKEAKKSSSQYRLRPLTRDNRPIIQKHRKLNEEHEQMAEAMGLPFRLLGATYVPLVSACIPFLDPVCLTYTQKAPITLMFSFPSHAL